MSDSEKIPESLAAQGFSATATPDVLTARTGSLARIMLNRPRQINALTTDMVDAISTALTQWRDDDEVTAVTIEGAGERGLCAGGDVVSVRKVFLDGEPADSFGFFEHEYRMNSLVANYPKLIVAYQDGIVMGGGVGLSAYAGLRLTTSRSRVAMPETIIGFFPDVGALYLLSRAPGGTGAYLALTGTTIGGHDAVYVGLSDAVIADDAWVTVLERLAKGANRDEAIAGLTVEGAGTLNASRPWIDAAFGDGDSDVTAEQVRQNLAAAAESNPDAAEALTLFDMRSPISVAASLEGLHRASHMNSVDEVLAQDAVLARGLVEKGDFAEGVRAQLVDKDRSPRWSQASVSEVTREQVLALFE